MRPPSTSLSAVFAFLAACSHHTSSALRPPSTSLSAVFAFLAACSHHTSSAFAPSNNQVQPSRSTQLLMSLKPAAIPLLDSGKALARSGELLIDATTALDLYGGGLSQAGASIRNSGDCVAQAAASCRFKTAAEATPVSEPSSPGMYAAGQFLCGRIYLLFIISTMIALLQK